MLGLNTPPIRYISDDPVKLARSTPIEDELARRGIRLRRQGRELVGPCPRCGGRDRFGVNIKKRVWNCRGCQKGGDVLDLVQHLDGCEFLDAVETLSGHRPRGDVAAAREQARERDRISREEKAREDPRRLRLEHARAGLPCLTRVCRDVPYRSRRSVSLASRLPVRHRAHAMPACPLSQRHYRRATRRSPHATDLRRQEAYRP
jgi:phage/plasmid primase-like uncharacterized protein